jgi:hypothetical protein
MFLIGKLIGYMLKYYRNNNLFLVCVISTRGRQKSQKYMTNAHFGVCLHLFTSSFDPSQTTKVCSIRFLVLRLQKCVVFSFQMFVVSAFKCLYCPLFSLQIFVISISGNYKSL